MRYAGVHVKFKWEDLWVGLFVKRYAQRTGGQPVLDIYLCLIPTVRIRFRWVAT